MMNNRQTQGVPLRLLFNASLSTMFPESTACVHISQQSAALLQHHSAKHTRDYQIRAETDGVSLSLSGGERWF